MSVDVLAIDHTVVPSPDPDNVSASLTGAAGSSLFEVELWSDVQQTLTVEIPGPDGVFRTLQTRVIAAGTPTIYTWPVILGTYRVRMTAAAAGWFGYAITRIF